MADINIEKKGPGIWPWIIGLLVLALIVWAIAEMVDPGEEEVAEVVEPVAEVQPLPETVAEQPGVVVSQIIASPATWTGRTLAGEVRVAEVPTDRGFWVEDQGQRLFALIIDEPAEQPKDINPGQVVRLEQATVRDPTFLANLPGQPIDADTRRIVESQPVFLVIDEDNINILGGQTAPTGGLREAPASM